MFVVCAVASGLFISHSCIMRNSKSLLISDFNYNNYGISSVISLSIFGIVGTLFGWAAAASAFKTSMESTPSYWLTTHFILVR